MVIEGNHDCALAIVGSRDVPRYAAESIIREAILSHKPKAVISGGATGIDTFAVEIAKEMGILTIEILPTQHSWAAPERGQPVTSVQPDGSMKILVDGGFQARNGHVATMCDCLVRIASHTSKTYGSGWTADQAEALGKHVIRHEV
jgi:DNA recombination-mediator protein A